MDTVSPAPEQPEPADSASQARTRPDKPTPTRATPDKATPGKAAPDKAAPTTAAPADVTPGTATPGTATPEAATAENARPASTTDDATADNATVDNATAATEPATATGATEPAPGAPKRGRGRPKGSSARTTRTVELILTVSGTADGEWQAELKQGASWITRGLPVSAAAVSRAAQELHAQLAEPIDAVIGAAREQRAARVSALEAELEQARKALAEMED